MTHLRKILTASVSAWLLGSGMLGLPAVGREARLEIYPQKVPAEPGKYSLLPSSASLLDADALPLYKKAIKALPSDIDESQFETWLGDTPVGQLPLQQVEGTLQRYMESLKYAARAARCRECNWPAWTPGAQPADGQEYRRLARVIRLWARLEIARDGYDGALVALQTGFGMVRHLGRLPTLVQSLIATAAGGVMCREVEQFVQGTDAPNLCLALADMPDPFIEVDTTIENERKAALATADSPARREQIEGELKSAHDRVRLVTRSVDSYLAALQCVEAIRSYAAAHTGQLPQALSDISDIRLPKQDPASGEPFRYTRTGATAVLESAIPAGGKESNRVRYEIVIKN
jgi:hypothetical protein